MTVSSKIIVSIISAVAFTATGVLAMYKSTVGAEESAYEMEYVSFSNNSKEKTHLKDIDHELKTHGFTYKKGRNSISFLIADIGNIYFVFLIRKAVCFQFMVNIFQMSLFF